eukprot:comp19603_c0_seq1/m.23083 comp19603_c0_seq1/g.23083  ORF comp19603_c0_seq1/g.23083 comp19603_c0_seq1/m.23083 type:complete len:1020 (-) comp19603_c0_seq1:139-3198(-)
MSDKRQWPTGGATNANQKNSSVKDHFKVTASNSKGKLRYSPLVLDSRPKRTDEAKRETPNSGDWVGSNLQRDERNTQAPKTEPAWISSAKRFRELSTEKVSLSNKLQSSFPRQPLTSNDACFYDVSVKRVSTQAINTKEGDTVSSTDDEINEELDRIGPEIFELEAAHVGVEGVPFAKQKEEKLKEDDFCWKLETCTPTPTLPVQALPSEEHKEKPLTSVPKAFSGRPTEPICSSAVGQVERLIARVLPLLSNHRGIKGLYDWQRECLLAEAENKGQNLVYCLPTNGGKTLVAEILLLRTLVDDNKNALFVLPYVSLVEEKIRSLEIFAEEFGFDLEPYCADKGEMPPRKKRKKRSLYIATIEKANGIINALVSANRLQEIGLVVVDELHFIGDGPRGAILEGLLVKAMAGSGSRLQVVGMSATLSNISDLLTFLNARIFQGDFRPTELHQYLQVEDKIYNIHGEYVRHSPTVSSGLADADHVAGLVLEVCLTGSCIVFCPTKQSTQNVALNMCRHLQAATTDPAMQAKRQDLANRLASEASLNPDLARTIPFGVGFHHSGLTVDERRLIEEAYSQRILTVMVCTSTLAAGINLPAKRVIIRSPHCGRELLTKNRYTQMVGRAGRAGLDSSGESFLLYTQKDAASIEQLVRSGYDTCHSHLLTDSALGLQRLTLDILCLGLANSSKTLTPILGNTLLARHTPKDQLVEVQERAVRALVDSEAVTVGQDGGYTVTVFGRAVFGSCMDVETARLVHSELLRAQHALELSTDLQLLYLMTPIDVLKDLPISWETYCDVVVSLGSACDRHAASLIGPSESHMIQLRRGGSPTIKRDKTCQGTVDGVTMSDDVIRRRFYLTLVLRDLLSERSVWDIAKKFNLSPGHVQTLMSTSAVFGSMMAAFVKELKGVGWGLGLLMEQLVRRIFHGVKDELLPLVEIQGVKQARARQLFKAGYRTVVDVAGADPSAMCENIKNLFPSQAKAIIRGARRLLKQRAAAMAEEAEGMLEQTAWGDDATLDDTLP